jgi:AraC family transcriptional regulator
MSVEIVQAANLQRLHMRFQAPVHLLVAYHAGARTEGETSVQGHRATLRDLRRKFVFTPAGFEFRDWHQPRVQTQCTCICIEPHALDRPAASLRPRLLFDNAVLWETVSKLRVLIESAGAVNRTYLEAVGAVLSCELARVLAGDPPSERRSGGVAGWQQRLALEYIEEHLSEPISLAALAGLARLSPHHFCRAFKQSLGRPPLSYQRLRRIERAKQLLAQPMTVTQIGLRVGFGETSSFTAAFGRETGLTPTEFRRNLI